jgi:hypothetical protein
MKEWVYIWPAWCHSPNVVYSKTLGWTKPPSRLALWYRTGRMFGWPWEYKTPRVMVSVTIHRLIELFACLFCLVRLEQR